MWGIWAFAFLFDIIYDLSTCLPRVRLSASATHLYTGQQSHLLSLLYMVTRQWKAYSEKKSRQSRASPVPLHMSICSQLSPPCYVSQNTSRNDFTSHKWNPRWDTELNQKVFNSFKPLRVKPWQEQEFWKRKVRNKDMCLQKIKDGVSDLKLNRM